MILLGVDFETTGLDLKEDLIIEIGAVLWDTNRGAPIDVYNVLLNCPDRQDRMTDEITKITGITKGDLQSYGIASVEGFTKLFKMILLCDYIVAHNGNAFDRPMFESEVKRQERKYYEEENNVWCGAITGVQWIDTMLDIPYPDEITTRKLGYLATEHGFINPFPHRAFADVLTILKVLSNYNIYDVVERSKSKTIRLIADVSYEDRQLAKDNTFRWNGDRKIWFKDMKEIDLAKLPPMPFEIQQ